MTKISFYLRFVLFNLFFMVGSAYAKTCPTFSDYKSDGVGDNFLLMPAFNIIIKACGNVAIFIWNTFSGPLQAVIAVGASLYIAVFTLKNVGAFSQQDAFGYLSNEKAGIIPLMVKIGVILLLLTNAGNDFLYGSLLAPVIKTAMDVGTQFSDANAAIKGDFSNASNVTALFQLVRDKIVEFNEQSYSIVAMGRELLCLTFLPDSIIKAFWSLLPFGLVLYVFGWLICIGVAFYMLDVLFRLAVACILLPFAVACATSKLTVNYCKKTWFLFVNVCFNFIVLGLLLGFSVRVLANAIDGGGNLEKYLTSNAMLTEADVERIVDNLSLKGFLLTFICCMMIFKLFAEIENIADTIVGQKSSVGKTAQAVGAPVVNGMKNAVTQPAAALGKAAAQEAGSSIKNSKAGKAVRRAGSNLKTGAKNSVKKFFGIKD